MDRLTFAVLSDSIAEIRRVPARCGRDTLPDIARLQQHFTIWERGTLLNAACFLLDFPQLSLEIPAGALLIARRVVEAEFRHGQHEELLAASMGGAPWRNQFAAECLQCGRTASWRSIVSPPDHLPPETCWRYDRPENQIPLCRRCVTRMTFRSVDARLGLARALWGARFEAFVRWHLAVSTHMLPVGWDKGENPLWPAEFGGLTWASGSGALAHSEPRMFFGVLRSPDNKAVLTGMLGETRSLALLKTGLIPEYELMIAPPDILQPQVVGAL